MDENPTLGKVTKKLLAAVRVERNPKCFSFLRLTSRLQAKRRPTAILKSTDGIQEPIMIKIDNDHWKKI